MKKVTSYGIIKSRTEGFIDSFNKAKTKLKSVITENLEYLILYLQNSSRKVNMKNCNESHECKIDCNHNPIESFIELKISQLKVSIAMKRSNDIIDVIFFCK